MEADAMTDKYQPIAFKLNGCVSLKDFDRMWDDLADLGVSLRMETYEYAGNHLYIEGSIVDSIKAFREVKKYCARTGGIEIDAETMRDWY